MTDKLDRFIKTGQQGKIEGVQILVDKETGVNYLFAFSGYSGGLTPLLDADGKPIVTPI
jgi:hypothetical protein